MKFRREPAAVLNVLTIALFPSVRARCFAMRTVVLLSNYSGAFMFNVGAVFFMFYQKV